MTNQNNANLLPPLPLADFFLSRFYITLCSPTPSGRFHITVAGVVGH